MFGFASCNFLNNSYLLSAADKKIRNEKKLKNPGNNNIETSHDGFRLLCNYKPRYYKRYFVTG